MLRISSLLRRSCRENRGALSRPTRAPICQRQPTTNSDKLSDGVYPDCWYAVPLHKGGVIGKECSLAMAPPSLERSPIRGGEDEPTRRLRGGHDQHRRLAGTDDPVGHAPKEQPLEPAGKRNKLPCWHVTFPSMTEQACGGLSC